jgi:transcriptional regulator with XRE-family HTH domain
MAGEGRFDLFCTAGNVYLHGMQETHQIKPEEPSPEVVAFFVRLTRSLAGWKKATLASVANVSLSTVERVERGDAVSTESLDKLAVALRQPPGAFTEPRIKLSDAEAAAALAEKWAWIGEMVPVAVSPLRKQAQLRELSNTVVGIVDHDLGDGAQDDITDLREWIGLVSFVRAEHEGLIGGDFRREANLRRLYGDVLTFVRDLERRQRCVCLVGAYKPETRARDFQDVSVGIISVKSKVQDPAAANRTILFAPAKINLADALARAFDGEADT